MIKLASSRMPVSSFRPVVTMDRGMEGPRIRRVLRCLHSNHSLTCWAPSDHPSESPGRMGSSCVCVSGSPCVSGVCAFRSVWQYGIPSFCLENLYDYSLGMVECGNCDPDVKIKIKIKEWRAKMPSHRLKCCSHWSHQNIKKKLRETLVLPCHDWCSVQAG